MAFDLFGSPTKCDIRVGYISTETGFVDGISVYEANKYAKVNPGTQFIFRNREKVQYLNINEVNKLEPEDMLPQQRSGNNSCGNIVGLNPQGDTTKDISETIGDFPSIVGGSSEEVKLLGGKFEKDSVRVNFYGGGGVGVQGNPVIGSDGSLLAVDLVHGGYGYQYAPIVDVDDDKGVGSGAVVRALVGGGSSVTIDEFDREEDFEEYDLIQCAPDIEKIGFGDRYGNDGKTLGAWDPSSYIGKKKDPLRAEIDKYQDILSKLKKDQRYDRKTDRILNWWTTRYEAPLAVTSPNKTTREKYDVQHYAWGGKRTVSAIDIGVESASPPPTPSNFKEVSFLVYTQGGHDRGLAFNFTAKDGSHKFSIKADKYRDGAHAVEEKIKVKVNTLYNVVSTGSHRKGRGTEQGLLTPSSFGKRGKEQDKGRSQSIFADLIGTNDDDDDLQIKATLGTFAAGLRTKDHGHDSFELTYKLADSSAFKAKPTPKKRKAEVKTTIEDSFMNNHAISPVPPSNVKGSDNAGKTYTFEWEEDFPFDGDYIFRGQNDNVAKLYIDNDPIADLEGWKDGPTPIKKTMSAGVHKITIDLLNKLQYEKVKQIRNLASVTPSNPAESNVVTFKISSAAQFANGIKIEGLGIDITKTYKGPQIKETITKTVEYGKPYDVVLTSSNQRNVSAVGGSGIQYTGLKEETDRRWASNKRLEFDDDSEGGRSFDVNGAFTIDNVQGGSAVFDRSGKSINVKGSNVRVTLTYSWNDIPGYKSKALESIRIADKTWTQLNVRRGSETHTVTLSGGKTTQGGNLDSNIRLRTKGEKVLQMEEWTDNDWQDIVCSATSGRFYDLKGNVAKFIVDAPPANTGKSDKFTGIQTIFNTVDWIKKADRKLWKINPEAGKGANFINRYGVLPFNPTEVAEVKKEVWKSVVDKPAVKPTAKIIVEGGKTYLKVTGGGRVKINFELNVNDIWNYKGIALKEVRIKSDEGEVSLVRREGSRRDHQKGHGVFTGGQKYLIKTLGGSPDSGFKQIDSLTIAYDDDISGGFDTNADLKITSVNVIEQPKPLMKRIKQIKSSYPTYPNASTDDFEGTHTIIWNNISFPKNGNYAVSSMVDDNVTLTFSSPGKEDIVIRKIGFLRPGISSGKTTDVRSFKEGTYTLKADLEQIAGKPLAKGNPMALAIEIKTAFVEEEISIVSAKSWNENPMGVALTIDAPMPPIPQEPPPEQEGRCPPSPFWTTRSPAKTRWWPVRVDKAWSKFTNRYAISPIPPLSSKGSDGAGVVYRNSWEVDLPYKGFYGIKGTADNFGKVLIDGKPVHKLQGFKNAAPDKTMIFLSAGLHEIIVEIENEKQFVWQSIDQKVFSTADWASKQTQTSETIEGPKVVDVTFKASSSADYANAISVDGLFSESKTYKGPQIKSTITKKVEVGKVYDVTLNSGRKENLVTTFAGTLIQYTGLKEETDRRFKSGTRLEFDDDSEGGRSFDVNGAFTIDKVNGGTARFSSDGKGIDVKGNDVKITLTYSWNDIPGYKSKALESIKIGTTTWTQKNVRRGSETHTIVLSGQSTGGNVVSGNNDGRIQLRTKGSNVLQMEDARGDDWNDLICSSSQGEWFDLQGNKCKFRVPSTSKTVIKYGEGMISGAEKNGVTYSGPSLASYTQTELGPTISPAYKGQEDFAQNFQGKSWTMTWKGVDFPETGEYDIQAIADDVCIIKVDGTEVARAQVNKGITKSSFNAPKGKHTIELTLNNIPGPASHTFALNPYVTAVKITRKVNVAKVDPRTGTALGKPWTVNPIGVSAVLIPPPCPKVIDGVGIVTDVVVDDPGNSWPPPSPDDPEGPPTQYPVILELTEVEPSGDPINYGPDDVVCVENTETGEEECFPITTGPFGEITGVSIGPIPPVITYPNIRVKTGTGVGAKFIPRFKIVRDPIEADPDKLIQVTDLVGLKQTGYYDGRPYYGAVFYKDGVRYAGMYETPGKLVQIYDTLQESIDAQVTTPPSAIQRQGTDINSNDPRLNIPGTPDNLT